jgi:hypothetical protein
LVGHYALHIKTVINDGSTGRTQEILNDIQKNSNGNLHVIQNPDWDMMLIEQPATKNLQKPVWSITSVSVPDSAG